MELTIYPDIINSFDNKDLITVKTNDSLKTVIELMSTNHIGAVLVTNNEDELEAIISERDIVRYLADPECIISEAKINHLMTPNPYTLDGSDNILKAFSYFYHRNCRHMPVLDGTKLIGMTTVSDLYSAVIEQLDDDLKNLYKRETFHEEKMKNFVNTLGVYFLRPENTVRDAAELMLKNDIGTIVVMDANKLEGVFSERDIILRVLAKDKDIDETTLETVMTREPKTLTFEDNCYTAIDSMVRGHYRHMPILSDSGEVLGILSMRDIYKYLGDQIERDVTLAVQDRADRHAFGV